MDEKKNVSAKIVTETEVSYKGQKESFITTEEKAQYEVFKNGNLPRETIERWLRNDMSAILSFVHGMMNDEDIWPGVVDKYYEKYKKLHLNGSEDAKANNKP